MKSLTAVSLFSGLGGMDLGLLGGFYYLNNFYKRNLFSIKFAMDFHLPTCDIYNNNFDHKCLHKDVTELKENQIPKHDILLGGFPCQAFSVSAQNPPRLGFKDDRGKLFFEMCRILKHHKPRFFVAENVKGILSANKKRAFPLIISEFQKAGYYVKYEVLNSVKFGVPQKRERVFIVGFKRKKDYLKFEFPQGNSSSYVPIKKILDAEETIEEKYYFSERAVEGLKNTKNYKIMNKGRAQCIEGPSNTVSAHLAKVSLNSTDPVLKIGGRYRMYTPREVARIQSFPESFKLTGSKTVNYQALGNAVAPVVMWHIAQQLEKNCFECR
ncbi:DNA (cytosine-5-)-methyltransferase [Piscirickettsia litoralis]|uniref:Cytosine-specific methyltransferase n=1 Tax=Piscirickettsia litoralis TaxID=1891921 RepID=A0ABX2ZXT7_9GAMM|nr:DNA (cytosine-5-)-methyltransferase [Piscirickettsia litoralis]ODN41411.1 DNA (cytosine-5-)-methyltransferase [Piscirickettsia litoralis]